MSGFLRWRERARTLRSNVVPARGQPAVSDATKKAFEHWRNADTGKWQPPKYSLRRQAQLVRAAHETGCLDAVSQSPKYERFARRLAELPQHEVLAGLPTPSWPALSPAADAKQAHAIARSFYEHGPYAGRSSARMFKGRKGDKASRSRRRQVVENMERMEETVREWRKVRRRPR